MDARSTFALGRGSAAIRALLWLAPLTACQGTSPQVHMQVPDTHRASMAFQWIDVMLEAAARDVERVGAAPTILSRQMAIPVIAMFEAWAAYDDVAVGPMFGDSLRRPEVERTGPARRAAVAHAMYHACRDQYPHHAIYLNTEFLRMGFDPNAWMEGEGTPAAIGHRVARAIVEARYADGANQLGDDPGSDGTPYSDTSGYRPVNPPDQIIDPDRWQPIPFDDGAGGTFVLDYLTPHWGEVQPFGLTSGDQFRPGPPPLVGSDELLSEVDEVIRLNASLDPQQKAIVEFMRDGPRSTGQSGHWLRFAQDVSVRDGNDLDADVKLFFAVGVTAMDAFIASWDAKRAYDSSRPWTLVRHYYGDQNLHAWGGAGRAVAWWKSRAPSGTPTRPRPSSPRRSPATRPDTAPSAARARRCCGSSRTATASTWSRSAPPAS